VVNSELTEVVALVRKETGIAWPAVRETAVRAALERAAPGLGPGAFVRAAADPAGGRDLTDRLIDEVTNQETSFLRDRAQLDEIDWPGLLRGARAAGSGRIRVWSAGCASGEEAYTLALLAAEAFAPAPAPAEVLGTDISGAALAAAVAGSYRERAMRALEPSLRGRYFQLHPDGAYVVGDRLRRLVRFRRHNLAVQPIPPPGEAGFDLVTCRNVLIYFRAPLAEQVIGSLERSLRPGGRFILGAADALQRAPGGPPRPAGPLRATAPARRQPLGRQQASAPRAAPSPGAASSRGAATSRGRLLAAALDAADQGDHGGAQARVAALLADNPLDADAHFIAGLVALDTGDPAAAVAALRRALYADAAFALGAFTLGRAYDALGDSAAARRAYERSLRLLEPAGRGHEVLLEQIQAGDIAAACRARLAVGR
jgi:chemotaxis protein methyltransferase CheR